MIVDIAQFIARPSQASRLQTPRHQFEDELQVHAELHHHFQSESHNDLSSNGIAD
jgi:hypothetical protein